MGSGRGAVLKDVIGNTDVSLVPRKRRDQLSIVNFKKREKYFPYNVLISAWSFLLRAAKYLIFWIF